MRFLAIVMTIGIGLHAGAGTAVGQAGTTAIAGRLLPKVHRLEAGDGHFELADPALIAVAPSASETTRRTARMFASDLGAAANRKAELTADPNAAGAIVLRIEPGANPQAYRLSVGPAGVVLTGAGEPGLFYGTRTLLQLIDATWIACCEIEDRPDYDRRMVLYDLAREHTFNMAHMKHVIDVLADYKVNMLHLYIENRFQFARHPEVSDPGVMTPAQARELDEYGLTKFVEIVPEINCLAHLENALSVEKYRPLAEDPKNPLEICTQNPEAVSFVQDLVGEVAACFRTEYFHMGGDEAWAMGKCPKCALRIKADGGKQGLFREHYTRMAAFIRSLGKRPMMWGDMLLEHRGTAENMPKDIIVFDWHYGDTSVDTVKYFTAQGFETYVCPAMSGFQRFAAPYQHATANIYRFIGQGKEGGAIGECTCAWELRLGHYYMNDYWGILLSADRSWNLNAGDLADYEKRFCKVFFGLNDLRPIKYYQELSDGYASVYGSVLQPYRPIWDAFNVLDRDRDEAYSKQITAEMLAESDKKLAELTEMLDDLRVSVKRNKDALEFADFPAHSTHAALRKFAFGSQVSQLIEQAGKEKVSDPEAARGKLERAIQLLEQIDKDQEYLERRVKEAAQRHGGSVLDPIRVGKIRSDLAKRIAEAKALMSK